MKNTIHKDMMDYFSQELERAMKNEKDYFEETEDEGDDFVYVLNSTNTKLETKDSQLAMLVTNYLNKKYGEK